MVLSKSLYSYLHYALLFVYIAIYLSWINTISTMQIINILTVGNTVPGCELRIVSVGVFDTVKCCARRRMRARSLNGSEYHAPWFYSTTPTGGRAGEKPSAAE